MISGGSMVIDCDALPNGPENGLKVVQHQRQGRFLWDQRKVTLWRPQLCDCRPWIEYHEFYAWVKGERTLNANVHDFLINNPELIPPEWQLGTAGRYGVFFFGTIFSGLRAQGLQFHEGSWRSVLSRSFDSSKNFHGHAAVLS